MKSTWIIGFSLICLAGCQSVQEEFPDVESWTTAEGPLATRWTSQVTPDAPHSEYPRPQMVRDAWINLNGLWEYAIRPLEDSQPHNFDGHILVPFAPESALSGVMRSVGEDAQLWYRRTFNTSEMSGEGRVLLHFGAVDWRATVWLNGKQIGQHAGGYDAFTFDISDSIDPAVPLQELVVAVWDPVDTSIQPRGKQVNEPEGIWYTSVTGIWQTVWLEQVPESSIASLEMTSDIDANIFGLRVTGRGVADRYQVEAIASVGGVQVAEQRGVVDDLLELVIDAPRLWSPEDPFLYDLTVRLVGDGDPVDEVTSYFGMRKIAVATDAGGVNRLFLNNEPVLMLGPLDQGWWPDGLYTAPTDEALLYDLQITKQLGFNMVRKHVKVEPERWYYHCDRLGLLVWQDMPNGDRHIERTASDLVRSSDSASVYHKELKAMIDTHANHPSIVVWVPFNEGWGQFDTDAVLSLVKEYDPTRLVDGPSGWADRGSGDIYDLHDYPGPPLLIPVETDRAVVLGEFGGLGLPLEGHLWWNKRNWGYRTYGTTDELHASYEELMKRLGPLVVKGLAAAVYTQTTDVEGEVNGLMTYDREVVKFDAESLTAIHQALYALVVP